MSKKSKNKNFHYTSNKAVVIITANKEVDAEVILKDVVKYPLSFNLENITDVN